MADFEDILDGYFPLSLSVADLLRRRGVRYGVLRMSFAPIIDVPDLPYDAPVPLSVAAGRSGMIYEAKLLASLSSTGADLSGTAHWRWFGYGQSEEALDPMTRLAEPALVAVYPEAEMASLKQATPGSIRQIS